MDQNKKKMIAPIIVTILTVIYFVVYFSFLIFILDTLWAILLGIIPLAFSSIMIYVCIERIKEIKKGEEDDLSKY